jgi:hypothetical protein
MVLRFEQRLDHRLATLETHHGAEERVWLPQEILRLADLSDPLYVCIYECDKSVKKG